MELGLDCGFGDQRVMPIFWYCLLRNWIRVDDVIFRLIDTRVLCVYESNEIIIERQVRESTYEALGSVRPFFSSLIN